jgi:signal transduction histidine kinase
LGNALKFTPAGGRVEVTVARQDDGATLMTVADTGIGMAAEDLPIALMPFGQAVSDPMVQSRGVGLGIPLTKHFIEQHGGSFTLSSAIGQGTRATLLFPASRAL